MRISTVLSAFVELYVLFGVQFDDKCFVNFDRKFFTLRKTSECSFEAFQVFFNVRKFERTKLLEISFEHFVVAGSFTKFNNVTWFTGRSRMECLHDDHLPKCGHGLPFDELDEWSYRSRCDIQGYQDVVPKESTCFDL